MADAKKHYRIKEFAELAGVTVRALHYYDRLGLLKPGRTTSGYRVYRPDDLERLEQIVALKFLGLPLKQIKTLLCRNSPGLETALQLQLKVLEDKRDLLDQAITAIREAEQAASTGRPADAALLKKIIELVGTADSLEEMKKYYSDKAWARYKKRQRKRTSETWVALMREVQTLIGQDPAGEPAQSLAARWMELWRAETGGDPEIQVGMMRAWADRRNWPAAPRKLLARVDIDMDIEAAVGFVSQALNCHRRKYYSDRAWAQIHQTDPDQKTRRAAAWYQLFIDVAASLELDPAGEQAQALARRWSDLAKEGGADDAEVRTGALKAWNDRGSWPASQQSLISSFEVERVVEFISKAMAASASKH
ncbi:MAG TPA: MerR family transcriptional regulator [Blastocatellia bacterium]|nr:MerR family transcriptional regulator [Blastocatellia bacterium]